MRHTRRFACAATLMSLMFGAFDVQGAVAAEIIRLNSGYVSLVKLDQTVGTIVIGNPDVVDATLQGKIQSCSPRRRSRETPRPI